MGITIRKQNRWVTINYLQKNEMHKAVVVSAVVLNSYLQVCLPMACLGIRPKLSPMKLVQLIRLPLQVYKVVQLFALFDFFGVSKTSGLRLLKRPNNNNSQEEFLPKF